MSTSPQVFVSIVSYNSHAYLDTCLSSLASSEGYEIGEKLAVTVFDNASSDESSEIITRWSDRGVSLVQADRNIGFCGGHNSLAASFIQTGASYFLVLNPDVRVSPDFLAVMCAALDQHQDAGSVTPLLLRGDEKMNPVHPALCDAAGMHLSPTLRHFDRWSNVPPPGEPLAQEYVFGGTGAALLLRREAVVDAEIKNARFDSDLYRVYPELAEDREERFQLFDEGFFAYREDADLAWRLQRLGWRCVFVPEAKAVHVRKVLPSNRALLDTEVNRYGVRNRFLLQLNNYSPWQYPSTILSGFIVRNILVVLGVLLRERSSLRAFVEVFRLARRARERYERIEMRAAKSGRVVRGWFSKQAEALG